MLLRSSVLSSERRYRLSSIISVETSVAGRFQFSTENAYSVSTLMPRRAEPSTDVADRVDAGAVPFDARQVALRRPAAVAVHDDGDVRRQPIEVDLTRQRLIGRAGCDRGEDLFEAHGN